MTNWQYRHYSENTSGHIDQQELVKSAQEYNTIASQENNRDKDYLSKK